MQDLKKRREEENKLPTFVYQCGFTGSWVVLNFGRHAASFKTEQEARNYETEMRV